MASRRVQLFGSLCVLVFLVNLARVVYAPLLQPLRLEFHLSRTQVGALATLAWAGSAAPRLPAGYALTRFRRHRVAIAAGLVLVGAATFAAAANSFLVLGVGAFLITIQAGIPAVDGGEERVVVRTYRRSVADRLPSRDATTINANTSI